MRPPGSAPGADFSRSEVETDERIRHCHPGCPWRRQGFGAVVALRDAALKVDKGQIVALMGANGAGKSTFVKILTGALRPDAGQGAHQGKGQHGAFEFAGARRSGLRRSIRSPR